MNDLFQHALEREERKMHVNSIIAYSEERTKLSKREKLILGHLMMEKKPLTDREIKESLFGVYADQNKVRPRITDLKRKGYVREVGKAIDSVTGKTVRLVTATGKEPIIK